MATHWTRPSRSFDRTPPLWPIGLFSVHFSCLIGFLYQWFSIPDATSRRKCHLQAVSASSVPERGHISSARYLSLVLFCLSTFRSFSTYVSFKRSYLKNIRLQSPPSIHLPTHRLSRPPIYEAAGEDTPRSKAFGCKKESLVIIWL
jgi:hypothetical protein